MEGVTYSLKDCLDLMAGLGVPVTEVRATGGGARSPFWRQLQADVFGVPVHRMSIDEGPSLGAALLAGVAVGAYADVFEACARIRLDPDVDAPVPLRSELYQRYHAAYRDLYTATAPVMHRLAALSEQDSGDRGP
jgi:xylulokinase